MMMMMMMMMMVMMIITDKTNVRLLLIRTFRACKLDHSKKNIARALWSPPQHSGRRAEEPGSWENFPAL